MSNEKKTAIKQARKQASTYVHTPRVASFKKSDKKEGYFVAVNKRAHKLLGRRTYATKAQLKALDGYNDVKVYQANGVLRTV